MADERDELIAELRAQIERMKCCGNCKYFDVDFEMQQCRCMNYGTSTDSYADGCDSWDSDNG